MAEPKKRGRPRKVRPLKVPGKPGPKPKPKADGSIPKIVTAGVLAEHLGLTPERIRQLAKQGVLERNARSTYECSKAVQSYVAWRIAAAERAGEGTSADALRARREQEIAQRMAVRDRDLIRLDDALEEVDAIVGALLAFVSGLPAQITGDPRERQRIELIIDKGRLRLSDRFAKSREAVRTGERPDEADDPDDA
jgi:hypothetical protein